MRSHPRSSRTPQRTPDGALKPHNRKRPVFSLGRISFGDDDESSPDENDSEACLEDRPSPPERPRPRNHLAGKFGKGKNMGHVGSERSIECREIVELDATTYTGRSATGAPCVSVRSPVQENTSESEVQESPPRRSTAGDPHDDEGRGRTRGCKRPSSDQSTMRDARSCSRSTALTGLARTTGVHDRDTTSTDTTQDRRETPWHDSGDEQSQHQNKEMIEVDYVYLEDSRPESSLKGRLESYRSAAAHPKTLGFDESITATNAGMTLPTSSTLSPLSLGVYQGTGNNRGVTSDTKKGLSLGDRLPSKLGGGGTKCCPKTEHRSGGEAIANQENLLPFSTSPSSGVPIRGVTEQVRTLPHALLTGHAQSVSSELSGRPRGVGATSDARNSRRQLQLSVDDSLHSDEDVLFVDCREVSSQPCQEKESTHVTRRSSTVDPSAPSRRRTYHPLDSPLPEKMGGVEARRPKLEIPDSITHQCEEYDDARSDASFEIEAYIAGKGASPNTISSDTTAKVKTTKVKTTSARRGDIEGLGGNSSDIDLLACSSDVSRVRTTPTNASATESSLENAWRRSKGESRWELEPKDGKGKAFSVPSKLYNRMYPHQRIGVAWMWGLHQGGVGGVLGDDMGLGKTFQVTCLLAGLFSTGQAKNALILAPKSVMPGWESEISRWLIKACCGMANVMVLRSEIQAKARRDAITAASTGGAYGEGFVLVSSYGMVSANPAHFVLPDWVREWDYVILDEGHKIRNASTRVCKAVHDLPTRRRLLLTGTPIQNNLKELHTVVDWATSGKLLGSYLEFQSRFSGPIEHGQDKDASEVMVARSRAVAASLRKLLAPHLLQRHKGEVMDEKAITKTEMVVWVALSKVQREIYSTYLGGRNVKDVLEGKVNSPLAAISHLKKVCLHPLVSSHPIDKPWWLDPEEPVQRLLRNCSKLYVLRSLVVEACDNGHRVLVFSRFVRMLDIIQRCLTADRVEGGAGLARFSRIDGSHSDVERKDTIASFNADREIPVCLVSSRAGGTGITLTGADRVILFDPAWNPAEDMQAVDRAYRIGQTRDVLVYRMIAAGTVEEKIYEKQVFKDGLRRTVMGSGAKKRKKNVRYFARAELKQLFTLYPPGECRVLKQLDTMHGTLRDRLRATESGAQRALTNAGGHLDFLHGLTGLYGASAHGDGLPKIAQSGSTVSGGAWKPMVLENDEESEEDLPDVPPAESGGLWLSFDDDGDEELEKDFDDGSESCADSVEGETSHRREANRRGIAKRAVRKSSSVAVEVQLDSSELSEVDGNEVIHQEDARDLKARAHKAKGGSCGTIREKRNTCILDGDVAVLPVQGNNALGTNASTAIALDDSDAEGESNEDGDVSARGDVAPGIAPGAIGATRTTLKGGRGRGTASTVPVLDDHNFVDMSFDDVDEPDGSEEAGDDLDDCLGLPLRNPPSSTRELTVGDIHSHEASPGAQSASAIANSVKPSKEGEHLTPRSSPTSVAKSPLKQEKVALSTCKLSPSSRHTSTRGGIDVSKDRLDVVQRGRERARQWAQSELKLDPTSSTSSTPSVRDRSGMMDEMEESEVRGGSSPPEERKTARVLASRGRAQDFAKEKLGMDFNVGKRSPMAERRPVSSREGGEGEGGETMSAQKAVGIGDATNTRVRDMSSHSKVEDSQDCDDWDSPSSFRTLPASARPYSLSELRLTPRQAAADGDGRGNTSRGDDLEASLTSSASLSMSPDPGMTSRNQSHTGSCETASSGDANSHPSVFTSPFSTCSAAGDHDCSVNVSNRPRRLSKSSAESQAGCSLRAQHHGQDDSVSKLRTPSFSARGSLTGDEPEVSEGKSGLCGSRSSYETAPESLKGEAPSPLQASHEFVGKIGREVNLARGEHLKVSSLERKGIDGSKMGGVEIRQDARRQGTIDGIPSSGTPSRNSPPPHPHPRVTASPGTVGKGACTSHAEVGLRYGFKCVRCQCSVGSEAADRAKALLRSAIDKEQTEEFYGAMSDCLEAVKLCDEEMELHLTIARIGKRLGGFS